MALATYRHECETDGVRGAYRRTAARYSVSPDTAERWVHRATAAQRRRDETPAELTYQPPDAAYESTRAALNAQFAAAHAVQTPQPAGDVMSHVAETPHAAAPERRSVERKDAVPPAGPQTPPTPHQPTRRSSTYQRPAQRHTDALTTWYASHDAMAKQLAALALVAMLVMAAF
jgi:FtsZ-interacting cell division protein ZipA